MRYELYGPKIPYVGKTLWEIVGNLKNFGVGRYIKRNKPSYTKGPCFFKILDVQCPPPNKNQFIDRKVYVEIEEWYDGLKIADCKKYFNTNIPKFQLIPKCEEHIFIKAAEECSKNFVKKEIPKYKIFPPLYKILWEREHKNLTGKHMEIPKLEAVVHKGSMKKVTLCEHLVPTPEKVDMHKLDTPVEDLIQEVVTLKKKINFLKRSDQ